VHLATARAGRSRRSAPAAIGTVVALVVALVATPAAGSQHERTASPPDAFGLAHACPTDLVPVSPFTDVPGIDPHLGAVACTTWYGLSLGGPAGRPADRFAPGLAVPRSQMATFVTRLLDHVGADLAPWDGTNRFADVDGEDVHVGAINRLAAAGIVAGGPGGTPSDRYAPDSRVDRAQMASYINRAVGAVLGTRFSADEVYFDDLGAVHDEHADNVNALARAGIVVGRVTGTGHAYDPGAPVRRNQMTSFLARTLSWLEADQPGRVPLARREVASSTTPLEPGQARNVNIARAAELIHGAVIAPGATFSLDRTIGERTVARGFVEDGFIDEGDITTVVGGGVSQMATTFLNAAWFAGIDLVDFRPHTIWFPRYPMCREATLAWQQLDVVVRNDSPYDIVVHASTQPDSATVALESTPWARVDSWTSAPSAAEGPGGAFTVRCGRTVAYPGGATSSDEFSWRYNEGYPG
jgi:hypothetical protein